MPQHDYIETAIKRHGRRLDHEEVTRKRDARMAHKRAELLTNVRGLRAKLASRKRQVEKIEMAKTIREHESKNAKQTKPSKMREHESAVPAYLMDREEQHSAKILSNTVKQKRKEKAGRWDVPLPKVKPISEDDMLKVQKSGKRKNKAWKRVVTHMTFVGEDFTRKPPKYERFVRPMGLRIKKAHVTHPELKATFQLPILGVKKNPQGTTFTGLGVISKGTIVEVDVSDLGLVTPGGKIVYGKYAQVTNNPENEGFVNAVLLV
jgi:ribosome biogenesis protein NSA2